MWEIWKSIIKWCAEDGMLYIFIPFGALVLLTMLSICVYEAFTKGLT